MSMAIMQIFKTEGDFETILPNSFILLVLWLDKIQMVKQKSLYS